MKARYRIGGGLCKGATLGVRDTRSVRNVTSRKQSVSPQPAGVPAAAEEEQKPSLFSNISAVQVVATGLAALTSMMLSSQIGVLGSVVSVFVSSAVSTVSAQIYKNVLAGGARKVKSKVGESTVQFDPESGAAIAEPSKTVPLSDVRASQAGVTTPLTADAARAVPAAGTTVLLDKNGEADGDAYAQEALEKAHARRASKAKAQKMAIVVAVVSAFVAIGITAGIVNMATAGNGWGEKTETIPTVSSIVAHHQDAASSSSSSAAESSSKTAASSTSSSSSNSSSSSSSSAQSGTANQSANESASSSQQQSQTSASKSSSSSSSSSKQQSASASSSTSSSSSKSADSSSSTSSSSSSNASGAGASNESAN